MSDWKRYEAIEVDGKWFVIDHRYPELAPSEQSSEAEAKMNARVWNIVSSPRAL